MRKGKDGIVLEGKRVELDQKCDWLCSSCAYFSEQTVERKYELEEENDSKSEIRINAHNSGEGEFECGILEGNLTDRHDGKTVLSRISQEAEISLAFTFMGVSGFLIRLVAGDLSDRIGRRRPILAGTLWASLLTFPLSFIRTPFEMIGVLSVRSLGWGLSDPSTQALLADIVDENKRGKIFGLLGSVGGVAMIAGPSVGGVVYELYGGEFSFAVCGFLSLAASVVLFSMIREPQRK